MTASQDERIYAEQVRLVLDGVAQSFAVGFLVATLMVAVLWTQTSHAILVGWYAAFFIERLWAVMFARGARRLLPRSDRIRRSERVLLLSKIVEGSVYGSLPFIALPLQIPAVSILTMSLMGALCSNGVSLLAPRPALYLALVVPIAALSASTLWGLGSAAYHALAVYSVLFIIGQYGQVVLASRRVRGSIALRFENAVLVEQLREETAAADIARREAEHANAAKSQLLAAASHDLRQPVHALSLFLQALTQTPLTDSQLRTLRDAQVANDASTDMLDKLLDLSRLDAGAITPQPITFALQPLFDRLEHDLAHFADTKGLIYRTQPTDFSIVSDPTLLEMVLRNFILNAIRYTDRGGVIVGCRRRGAGASIEVYDTGIGIPDDEQQAIFRDFYQIDDAERDGRKGVGLGLAIAQRLAVSLEHPLSLSSRAGRGSVFRILVPAERESVTGEIRPKIAEPFVS